MSLSRDRLSPVPPEHKYPAALNGVVLAASWLAEFGSQYGIDGERLALGGDSSGANLGSCVVISPRFRRIPNPVSTSRVSCPRCEL